jgi:zinc transport system substrate-binding protein
MKSRKNSIIARGNFAVLEWRRPLMTCLCLFVLAAATATAAPQVATSIRPLQLIAAAITEGVSQPQLVLGNGQDPHHASLRPSDRKVLAQADIVLWVGPMLELPLVELIADMGNKGLAIQNMDHIILLEVEGNPDPHVWLDTRNARQIATRLEQALVELDPGNGQFYQANLEIFSAALDDLDNDISQDFSMLQSQPWTVYHNAFRYFAEQFGLTEPLAPTESANNQPGIRSIVALRAAIQQHNITCMLTEPDVNRAELQTLFDKADLDIVTADVMGHGLEATADAYVLLMQNFANTLAGCLQGSRR